jgi:hypothetical protein
LAESEEDCEGEGLKVFRLLITGSRTWDDYDAIQREIIALMKELVEENPALAKLPPSMWFNILHGNCPKGADMLADHFARTVLKIEPELYNADWRLGKRAGFLRNARMVDTMPDACLAFIRDKSNGATNCRNLAKSKGIPTQTIEYTLVSEPKPAPKEWKGI